MDTFWNSYQREMSSLGLGTALWQPSPPIDAKTGEYLYMQIEVGDVGIIRAGVFHKLFNVFLAHDHRYQTQGTPRDFSPLITPGLPTFEPVEDLLKAIAPMGGPLGPGPLHSQTVECRSINLEVEGNSSLITPAVQLNFSCKKQSGASLVLPHRAERYDAVPDKLMKNYMVANHSDWLEFAEGLGMDVMLEDLCLITGCDRTDEWAMAVFRHTESETTASASITIPKGMSMSASLTVTWDATTSVLHHYGPYRRETSGSGIGCSTSEGGSLHNQTVFIRGFRMKKQSKWIAPKVIRASAGYHNLEFDPEDDDYSGVPSDMSTESDHSSDNDVEAVQNVAKETNPVCDLLDYILDSCPEAEVAIAHDHDLHYYTHNRHDSISDEPNSIYPEASQRITLDDGVASFGSLSGTTFSFHTGLDAPKYALSSPAVSAGNKCLSTPLQIADGRERRQLEKYDGFLVHGGNAYPRVCSGTFSNPPEPDDTRRTLRSVGEGYITPRSKSTSSSLSAPSRSSSLSVSSSQVVLQTRLEELELPKRVRQRVEQRVEHRESASSSSSSKSASSPQLVLQTCLEELELPKRIKQLKLPKLVEHLATASSSSSSPSMWSDNSMSSGYSMSSVDSSASHCTPQDTQSLLSGRHLLPNFNNRPPGPVSSRAISALTTSTAPARNSRTFVCSYGDYDASFTREASLAKHEREHKKN